MSWDQAYKNHKMKSLHKLLTTNYVLHLSNNKGVVIVNPFLFKDAFSFVRISLTVDDDVSIFTVIEKATLEQQKFLAVQPFY